MVELLAWADTYKGWLLFGVVLNFTFTIGYGVYKSLNLSYEDTLYLMQKYPMQDNTVKLLFIWAVPFLGFVYVLVDVVKLQLYLNHGKRVYDYIEDKLRKAYAKREH